MNDPQRGDLLSLIRFLKECKNLIGIVLENADEFVLKDFVADKSFWSILLNTWEIVQEDIDHAIDQLRSDWPEYETNLKEHGLTGVQLEFKLNLFNKLLDFFNATRGLIWLHRLLSLINTILGSLTDVIPGVGKFTEFKGAVEQIVKKRKAPTSGARGDTTAKGIRKILITPRR